MLVAVRKIGARLQTIDLCPCRFVPLVAEGRREEGRGDPGKEDAVEHRTSNIERPTSK
jgi:hypothetical protein